MAKLNLQGAQFKKVTFNEPRSDLCTSHASGALTSHLGGEHGGAGPDAPAHHRLCDPALFDSFADFILLRASNLHQGGQSVVVLSFRILSLRKLIGFILSIFNLGCLSG